MEVRRRQLAVPGRPGEHRHQVRRPLVLAHQHRRQLLADLHQVGEIGDVVFGDQVLDHADALEPRTRAQRVGDIDLVDAGHRGDRRVGLLRTGHLELDQQAAQVALVPSQRAIQEQRAFGGVELQQAGQRVDVLLDQRRFLLQAAFQPVGGGTEHRQQVLRRVLDVLVDVEEQRRLLVWPAPAAVALDEGVVAQAVVAEPLLVATAACLQEFAQPRQHRHRPDQVPTGQRQQAVPVATQVEAPDVAHRQREHELRAHAVEHRRFGQARRQHHPQVIETVDHEHLWDTAPETRRSVHLAPGGARHQAPGPRGRGCVSAPPKAAASAMHSARCRRPSRLRSARQDASRSARRRLP